MSSYVNQAVTTKIITMIWNVEKPNIDHLAFRYSP